MTTYTSDVGHVYAADMANAYGVTDLGDGRIRITESQLDMMRTAAEDEDGSVKEATAEHPLLTFIGGLGYPVVRD